VRALTVYSVISGECEVKPTFIDLFSGIGGFRLGLERVGFKCVWSCDNDKYANQVYTKRFGAENHHAGDVRQVDAEGVPDHDLLCAGFPCQAFSVAGRRKGFEDTRGTLFFEICRIAEAKKPPLLLLENVKGLLSHDEGFTFQVILESLEELGYWVEWQVLNSKHFGVPQNRERVFIIGHLGERGGREVFPIGETIEVDKEVGGKAEIKRVVGSGREMARIYAPEGISPTIRVPSGGWHQPNIATCIDRNYRKGVDKHGQRTMIMADRTRTYAGKGRNLESPKPISNAISSVQKDNLVVQAVELTYRKANMKRGRFSKVCHALDQGSSKGVILHNIYGGFKEHSPTIRTPKGGDHIPYLLLRTAQRKPQAKAIKKVGNIFPSGHEAGDILHPGGISGTLRPMEPRGPCKVRSPKIVVQAPELNFGELRIRRLTPIECERLQGFPDGWTEGVSDTQRYKLLGNAVTVPVIEFLGRRILDRCFQQGEA